MGAGAGMPTVPLFVRKAHVPCRMRKPPLRRKVLQGCCQISSVRSCALVAVGIKCSGPTIGVSTATCDLLNQRHADGGFARVPGGWGLSLASGGLWCEGRRVGQVPPEFRGALVGTRISMRL